MKKYILAIDQGTTSTRAILFDKQGQIISTSQREITMYYPKEGYIEQDAYEIWTSTLGVMAECMLQKEIIPNEVATIGITNQRETTILWNRKTGKPIYNAIVWQSKQSDDICEDLKQKGLNDLFKEKTGLLIDPYFSGTKIKWVLENIKGAKELMEEGNLMFGTVDSWLLYKLTGQQVHKTDYTNASRTLLFNINTLSWDQELLDLLEINSSILPEVCDSNHHFGKTAPTSFFGYEIPITGILGDQQAALFGQGCFTEGSIKNTYGTGCFMLMNTGNNKTLSKNGLLTTIGYAINGEITYALEGSVFVAGSAVQWLRDQLEFFKQAKDSETLATTVDSTNGVIVVPAFAGLGTPYWVSQAKGAIYGITRSTTKNHITRATLESLAFQTKDIIEVMSKESNISPQFLKVDGGASLNNFLMQFQADILNIDIIRPLNSESTALGAAFMSGLSVGFFKDLEEVSALLTIDKEFNPVMSNEQSTKLYSRWQKAVQATITFQ